MRLCISLRSLPALNARPAPVMQHHGDFRIGRRLIQRGRGGVIQLFVERVEDVGPIESQGPHPLVVGNLENHASSVCANRCCTPGWVR